MKKAIKMNFFEMEQIIKQNTSLKNKELAKLIGKSVSYVKALKAFLNTQDKEKFKHSNNALYKAIYNAYIRDKHFYEEQEDPCKTYKQKITELNERIIKDQKKCEELKEKYEIQINNLEEKISSVNALYSNLEVKYRELEIMLIKCKYIRAIIPLIFFLFGILATLGVLNLLHK
jgi:ElaB/YqjD/DUF883 family membrane-anchored ribosome-binding protein